MKIAVEGCCHGELDRTYAELKNLENQTQQRVDALIIGGDFQAIRNQSDLLCMAVPQKYRQLGQFHEYYTGQKTAPVLTIVVGGNHEASNYLWELYHGGWLAPNIYYLGGSGCVRLNGIRIAGASGIFKHHDYNLGHFERIPYDNSALRSVYHVRAYDVCKLSLLTPGPEVMISHDWPEGIYKHGNTAALLRAKPFFKSDIDKGELGNPHMMDLMKALRPSWWFAAHLHVRFQAEYDHTGGGVSDWGKGKGEPSYGRSPGPAGPSVVKNADEIVMDDDDEGSEHPSSSLPAASSASAKNTDEIVMDDDDDEAATAVSTAQQAEEEPNPDNSTAVPTDTPSSGPSLPYTTKFLALDKCLPRRRFLEIVDIPSPQSHFPPRLTFDVEWLAISKAMHPLLSTERKHSVQPRVTLAKEWVKTELEWIKKKIASMKSEKGDHSASSEQGKDEDSELEISSVQQFVPTATGPNRNINPRAQPSWYTNPQTEAFCALIEVENKVNPVPPGYSKPS
ncbi:hypothetical protein CPB86DRAFT_568097 [Serendipita vermifera]|nr:hypothetical protein CPB86DRAFT_568097 [Serendipita vermifera]